MNQKQLGILVALVVVIGGIGSFEGPIIGSGIYFVADKVLTGLVGEYFYIVLGVIGILVMLFGDGTSSTVSRGLALASFSMLYGVLIALPAGCAVVCLERNE